MKHYIKRDAAGNVVEAWEEPDGEDFSSMFEGYEVSTDYVPPSPPLPTVEEKIKALTDAIQSFMDKKVHDERGYDDVFTAISYINSTNRRFATEARQVLEWRDAIWTLSNSLLAQFKAGAIEEMTAEEVIAKFPPLVWLTEPIE